MKKKILILGIVIVICLIGGYFVWQMSTPISLALKKASFKEVEHVEENKIENFSRLYPGYKLFSIWGYTVEKSPYPRMKVIAVSKLSGRTFILPEEFEKLNAEEGVRINSKRTIFQFVDMYIHVVDNKALILEKAEDIPWQKQPRGAKDPLEFKDIIKQPKLLEENGSFKLWLYTWHPGSGKLMERLFEVKDDRINVKSTEIAAEIGDWKGEVFS